MKIRIKGAFGVKQWSRPLRIDQVSQGSMAWQAQQILNDFGPHVERVTLTMNDGSKLEYRQ